jgi:hypothetical protein
MLTFRQSRHDILSGRKFARVRRGLAEGRKTRLFLVFEPLPVPARGLHRESRAEKQRTTAMQRPRPDLGRGASDAGSSWGGT